MGAFYTEHDADNSRVGLATAKGTKSTITVGMPPTEPMEPMTTTSPNNDSNPILVLIEKIIEIITNLIKKILGMIGL